MVLAFGPDTAMLQEGVERQRGTVESAISARMGATVNIRLDHGRAVDPAQKRQGGRPSASDLRADRLQSLRGRDPALDVATDALDLELVDEA